MSNLKEVPQVSKNHVGFSGKFEYFTVILDGVDKGLFRALATNPIVCNNDYRQGARSVMASHLITDDYLKLLGL